tara:strand:- start:443 stop:982 length:540 start_codon:yes stop_codon:yes gene_type:complete
MAHSQQRDFFMRVKNLFPDAFRNKTVLEIGSLNINGTIRDLFHNCDYLGVDVGPGKDVDLVAHGEHLDFADDSYDVTVSAECFEHNPEWAATFQNMWRMSNTYVFFTCASTGRPEHGTRRSSPGSSPLTTGWDYYRNLSQEDFETEFAINEMFDEYQFDYNPQSQDLYFWGIKQTAFLI